MTTPNTSRSSDPLWTPEDLGSFIGQVRDDRFFALWMLATTTGMQLNVLRRVERRDVDLDRRRIRPRSAAVSSPGHASAKHRSYALDPTAYDALKEHVDTWGWERYILGQDTRKLFVWSNGQQVDGRALRTMFRQHCEEAGVPVVPLKDVRHAYVLAALESGIPARVISERLYDSAHVRRAQASEQAVAPSWRRRAQGSRSYRIESRPW